MFLCDRAEGFVTAEVLASGLEKVWLTLHIQVCKCLFILLVMCRVYNTPSLVMHFCGNSQYL
jgi:hypothetical protein